MNIDDLSSFITVASEKSISKAAQSLFLTQPALSTRIRRLEKTLGVNLIERNWEGVKLTKQGSYLLSQVVQMVQDFNNAITVVNNNGFDFQHLLEVMNTDKLHIYIDKWLAPLFIKPISTILKEKHPDKEYKIITRSTKTILDLIKCKGIDLGIFYQNEAFEDVPGVQTITLLNDKAVFLCNSKNFLKINGEFRNINLLKNEPFVLFDNPILVYFRNKVKEIIKMMGFLPQKFHIVNDVYVMGHIIASTNSYTIVPYSSIFPLINSSLPIHFLPLGNEIMLPKIVAAYSNSKTFLEIVDSLHSYCIDEYSDLL